MFSSLATGPIGALAGNALRNLAGGLADKVLGGTANWIKTNTRRVIGDNFLSNAIESLVDSGKRKAEEVLVDKGIRKMVKQAPPAPAYSRSNNAFTAQNMVPERYTGPTPPHLDPGTMFQDY